MRRYLPAILSVYIAFVFVQSLFFKFSDSAETRHIFSTLDAWGTSLGCPGLFAPGGLFSQYVVGSVELVASVLLLTGLVVRRLRVLNALGALVALSVISGAIFFHLFTPLGVVVHDDGGLLFLMACGVWIAAAVLLWLRWEALAGLLRRD